MEQKNIYLVKNLFFLNTEIDYRKFQKIINLFTFDFFLNVMIVIIVK